MLCIPEFTLVSYYFKFQVPTHNFCFKEKNNINNLIFYLFTVNNLNFKLFFN